MNGGEKRLSLPQLGGIVHEQLGRLDFAAGEEYLTGVRRIVEPLQERIDSARGELCDLLTKASEAEDTAALRTINDRSVTVSVELFVSLRSVPMVHEFCTSARDAIAERALELARRELYFSGMYCDVPLSLLSVGSDGRREQSLFTDQDYLFLYGSGEKETSQSDDQITDYFGMLGSVFATKLEEAGIAKCSGGIMPVNDVWRGSLQQWRERLSSTFRFEKIDWEKHVLNLIALMDARFVSGDRALGLGFGPLVRSMARDNFQALQNMARVVSAMRLPKGFLRRFVVEAEGPYKGEFNLKVLAWMPLIMCVRLLAVNFGIEETSTLERIRRLRSVDYFSEKMEAELTDAYHLLTGHRILQQIKRLKRIIDDDCYINPYELQNREREELWKAIDAIEELQHKIRRSFSIASKVDSMTLLRR